MKYVIQIWLITVIVSPLLLAFIMDVIVNESSPNEMLNSYGIIVLMIIVGFFLSIPAMVLFWIIERNLDSTIPFWKKKVILSCYSFLSVWATFFIADSGFIIGWDNQTIWVLIYSLTIFTSVWIFKLPKAKKSD